MQFTEDYDEQKYPKTKWTTKFFILEGKINGMRILKNKPWNLTIDFFRRRKL